MKNGNLHVLPLGAGWAVKFEDQKKFEIITRDKQSAVEFAKNLIKNTGTKLIIHEKEEQLDESFFYNWEVYISEKFGFSIQYRDDFLLNESYIYAFNGPNMIYKGVSFGIPPSFLLQTNLMADTFISVEVLPLNKGCKARSFVTQMDKIIEDDKIINGLKFNYAEIEEGAMGKVYEEKLYTYSGNSFCYGIRLLLASHRFEFYDPGTVSRFDRKSIMDILDKMLSSFKVFKNL